LTHSGKKWPDRGRESRGPHVFAGVTALEFRAMDRHRFVPSSETLDQRTLLSSTGLFGQSTASRALTGSAVRLPDTFNEKLLRIQRVPFYLDHLQSERFLPPAALKSLQTNMVDVAARLHPAAPQSLRTF